MGIYNGNIASPDRFALGFQEGKMWEPEKGKFAWPSMHRGGRVGKAQNQISKLLNLNLSTNVSRDYWSLYGQS
jgi:hypothetical protein